MSDQTSEMRMSTYILEALEDGQTKTNDQIRNWVERKMQLAEADLLGQNKRPYDKWHQTANNALGEGRGLHKLGYIERLGGGHHRITAAGKAHLEEIRRWRSIFDETGFSDAARSPIHD